jgi:hypothetical protein
VVAFAPATYDGGAVPDTFIGCGGGIAHSDRIADPAFDFGQTFTDYDSEADYVDTGGYVNADQGLSSSACVSYAAAATSPGQRCGRTRQPGLFTVGLDGLAWPGWWRKTR